MKESYLLARETKSFLGPVWEYYVSLGSHHEWSTKDRATRFAASGAADIKCLSLRSMTKDSNIYVMPSFDSLQS
jgi:hypothetical protein